MKRTLFSLLVASALVLSGCGGNGKNGNGDDNGSSNGDKEQNDGKALKGFTEKHLAKHGLPLKMMIPKKNPNKGIPPAKIQMNNRGQLEIKAGKNFMLTIMEGPAMSLKDKKKDIKNLSQALEITFVEESEKQLVYKSAIPNSEKEYFHFVKIVNVQGTEYVVESMQKGEFSRKDVEKMMKAAESLSKAAMPNA